MDEKINLIFRVNQSNNQKKLWSK